MIPKNEIQKLAINLETDGKRRFYLTVDSEGYISRKGTGRMIDDNDDVYIGRTSEPLFKKLLFTIGESLLRCAGGVFKIDSGHDVPCRLTILLGTKNKAEAIVFEYGYQSGLPDDVRDFLKTALELTEPWYQHQKKYIQEVNRLNNPV